jgi:hypothetical protein
MDDGSAGATDRVMVFEKKTQSADDRRASYSGWGKLRRVYAKW